MAQLAQLTQTPAYVLAGIEVRRRERRQRVWRDAEEASTNGGTALASVDTESFMRQER